MLCDSHHTFTPDESKIRYSSLFILNAKVLLISKCTLLHKNVFVNGSLCIWWIRKRVLLPRELQIFVELCAIILPSLWECNKIASSSISFGKTF